MCAAFAPRHVVQRSRVCCMVASDVLGGSNSMRKIDVFPHIFPKPLLDKASEVAVEPALGQFKRNSGIQVLYDLDARFRAMDQFGDEYCQILTISDPPIESIGEPPLSTELAGPGRGSRADRCVGEPARGGGSSAPRPLGGL